MERGDLANFARMIYERAPGIECISLRAYKPKPELLEEAQQRAAAADLLVLATRSAHLMPEQAAMARNLLSRAQRSILLCLRNPYDAGILTGANAIFCACGDSTPSLQATADALFGEFVPTGRLPVQVTG
jgi:hypothetical protein